MSDRSVTHATFVVERSYAASPARVFAAWANPAAKARWFVGPHECETAAFEIDFRVGGREINRGGPKGGPVHSFEGHYHDIVPNQRIVYTYDMHLDDTRISVSLATVALMPAGNGTQLIFTEQGAFLDGYDNVAQREQGTRELLDALGAELRREVANA
jgi:uncharacterized protein YndB with AHSA1/START domain